VRDSWADRDAVRVVAGLGARARRPLRAEQGGGHAGYDPGEAVGAGAQIGAGARLRGRGACAGRMRAAARRADPALADLPGNQPDPFFDALRRSPNMRPQRWR